MSPRKKPTCQTCGNPMTGHKRPKGVPICPPPGSVIFLRDASSSSASPEPSRASPAPLSLEASWHYRNPRWQSPPPEEDEAHSRGSTPVFDSDKEPDNNDDGGGGGGTGGGGGATVVAAAAVLSFAGPPAPCSNQSATTSGTSTAVAAVNTNTNAAAAAAGGHYHSFKRALGAEGSIIDRALKHSLPLASLFSTPAEDVARVQFTAQGLGLHTGLLRKPRPVGRERSWWMIVGKSGRAVQTVIDAHQRDMPGRLHDPDVDLDIGARQAIIIRESACSNFFSFMLAGAVGAGILFYLLCTVQ